MTLRDELLAIARRRAAGDDEGALAALDALGAEHPDDPYVLHARGRAIFDRGFLGGGGDGSDQQAGIDLLQAAVERAPADPWLHTELAFAREWGKADAAGAEAEYRRALALEPDFPDALLGAAALHGNPSADVSADEADRVAPARRPAAAGGRRQLAPARAPARRRRAPRAGRAGPRSRGPEPGAEPDLVAEQWPD